MKGHGPPANLIQARVGVGSAYSGGGGGGELVRWRVRRYVGGVVAVPTSQGPNRPTPQLTLEPSLPYITGR